MSDCNLDPLDFGVDPVENRQAPRHAADLVFAALYVHGNEFDSDCDQAFGVVLDLCEGGIRVATPQPPDVGRTVEVSISLEEDIFEVIGEVRWVTEVRRATYEVGLRFDPEDPGKLELLSGFLAQVRANRATRTADESAAG